MRDGKRKESRSATISCVNKVRSRLRRHFKQATKFILCGLIGAAIEFSILYVLVGRMHVSPVIAYIFSGGIPSLFVFFFNRNVTFRVSDQNTRKQSRRFILVYSFTFVLSYVLSSSFYLFGAHVVLPLAIAQTYGVSKLDITYGAKVLAIGVTAVVNYTFSHLFIFKKEPVPMEAELAVF